MLGITNHSKVPIRLATFAGFGGACLSFFIALGYLIAKLIFWSTFELGLAPLLIGVFFMLSIVLVCLGIMGEYVGSIFTRLQHLPYAVELDRVNWENTFGHPRTDALELNGITAGNPLTNPAPSASAVPSPS